MENKNIKNMIPVVLVSLLVLLGAFTVVNAQGQDNGAKPAKEPDMMVPSNDTNPLLFDAQVYASNMNVSVKEALRRLKLQDIPMPDEELRTKEAKTFAGLWIEHTPEFKVVVQFTRDGEETMKPYLKKYPEFADLVEVRNTATVSLSDLKRARDRAVSSASTLGIITESDINLYNNSVELYLTKSDKSRFDNALQREKIQLPDKVKVIAVEAEKMGILQADIYGGLPLIPCTSGFSVKKSDGTKGITTAGHCDNLVKYNGTSLTFKGEKLTGSYDIQWHTASGYTVKNQIQWYKDGSTRSITAKKSRTDQQVGGYVCKYGKTSYYTCGYISSKDFAYQGAATYIRVDNTGGFDDLSSAGDSGGPWFLTSTAYGTHVGEPTADPNDAVYMAVNYVDSSGLGITVMTSP